MSVTLNHAQEALQMPMSMRSVWVRQKGFAIVLGMLGHVPFARFALCRKSTGARLLS